MVYTNLKLPEISKIVELLSDTNAKQLQQLITFETKIRTFRTNGH